MKDILFFLLSFSSILNFYLRLFFTLFSLRNFFICLCFLMITLLSFIIFWICSFLFSFFLPFFVSIFVKIGFKLLNVFYFLFNQVIIKSALYTKIHLIHDMSELTISVLLKPWILANNKTAFSLNTIPTFSKHVLFLLLRFLFESRFIWKWFWIFW